MTIVSSEDAVYKELFGKMVNFVKDYGVTVNTATKARGHQGFFLNNRIDISSNLPYKRKIEVLIHEFTHYVHSQIDKSVLKNGGSLENLFPESDIKRVEEELLAVTAFVDGNRAIGRLAKQRNSILEEIKEIDNKIKSFNPDFKRSYSYKPFEKNIKKTDAKYLLKYDRVKVKAVIFGETKLYSLETIDNDFPTLSAAEKLYIKLKSKQRVLRRISSRTNKLNKYYKRPTELFARFVEGLFIDTHKISEIAPHAYLRFCSELSKNKYHELAELINNFF